MTQYHSKSRSRRWLLKGTALMPVLGMLMGLAITAPFASAEEGDRGGRSRGGQFSGPRSEPRPSQSSPRPDNDGGSGGGERRDRGGSGQDSNPPPSQRPARPDQGQASQGADDGRRLSDTGAARRRTGDYGQNRPNTNQGNDNRTDRRDDRRDDRQDERGDNRSWDNRTDRRDDRRDDRRYDRRDDRGDRRYDRRNDGWNERRRNSYYNDRDFYGYHGPRRGYYYAPNYGYYQVPNGYYGYNYGPGDYLPRFFFSYRVLNYSYYDLPYPPAGCGYVFTGNNIALIDLRSGLILQIYYSIF